MTESRPSRTFVPALAALALAGTLIYGLSLHALIRAPGWRVAPGWTLNRSQSGAMTVGDIEPLFDDGALQTGDRVLEINHARSLVRGLGWVAFADLRPGDRYDVRIIRAGSEVSVSLPSPVRASRAHLWAIQVPLLLISVVFFVSGLVTVGVRRSDLVAQRYAWFAIVVAGALIPYGVFVDRLWEPPFRTAGAGLRILGPLVPIAAYRFFSVFPPGVTRTRGWSLLNVSLHAATLCLLPGAVGTAAVLSGDTARATRLIAEQARLFAIHDALSSFLIPITLVATLGLMVHAHVVVSDATSRRRLRWLLVGSVAGTAPFVAVFIAAAVVPSITGRPIDYHNWLRAQAVAQLCLIALPVTFAYAVVYHRVIGVDVVIRRSLQYLLARQALAAAVLLPVAALVVQVFRNRDRTVSDVIFDEPLSVALGLASGAALLSRNQIRQWLDRSFFRQVAAREHVLIQLAEDVRAVDGPDAVEPLVRAGLEQALHPRSVHVCLVDPLTARLRVLPASSGSAAPPPPDESTIAESLQRSSEPLDWPSAQAPLGRRDAEWLARLDAHLLVPLGGGEQPLHGLIVLGERASDEPYSIEDRRLLKAAAAQLAALCENAALREQAARGARIERDLLAHVDQTAVNLAKECPLCGRCYDRADHHCSADGMPLQSVIPVIRTLADRYRLDRRIGHGGMGAVYRARDLRLSRDVAVKLLTGAALSHSDARRRFHREALACARLRHPNIVTVYDYGSTADIPYLVLELLTGRTLRAVLADRPAMAAALANWFDQILAAVAFAHDAGIIHRDLKPENIFVLDDAPEGAQIKILDFGVAKLAASDGQTASLLTETGGTLGTLMYMSPEQLSGAAIDSRSDIFALGVIALEALSGRHPFRGADSVATVGAILSDDASLSGETTEARALNEVIQRSLAKRPADRYRTVGEMREALIPCLASYQRADPGSARAFAGSIHPTEAANETTPRVD